MMNSFDYKTWKEELWNAITHGVGFIASIPALIVLILAGVRHGSAMHIVTFSVFGASVIILFLMSTLLHSMPEKYKYFFCHPRPFFYLYFNRRHLYTFSITRYWWQLRRYVTLYYMDTCHSGRTL